ncbi:hypothetical protein T09_3166 [Trichinella sp. T9]|nr:hypothetical protein T09_3166 [Trichinella sp. T9]
MGSKLTSVMAAFLLIETQLGRVHHATSGFSSPRPKANKNQSETLVLSNQAGRCALASRRCRRLTIWKIFFQKFNCRVQNLNNAPQFGCLSASCQLLRARTSNTRGKICANVLFN